MRQHIYRAKRKDNGEWVMGSLIDGDYILNYIDLATSWTPGTSDHKLECRAYEIDPKTVGQYIGVKGFIGTTQHKVDLEVKLFEGDVVEAFSQGSRATFVIKWSGESTPRFYLYPAWQNNQMWNIHGSSVDRKDGDYYDSLRVLGNIYDQPELIKQ
ncbi:YopX family protein [Paraflavitalea sp. CAU 1676]|uniref:YopX family protein n=1 Tax=Paraflavitalea sp. CAU 1676 TaxID=3032598 RepID=UPI0023DA3C6C|nr:YopX family protein [Paraflavitalea sp. CAU 1676]MDF2189305.1 YopX family protein [Paraflavitalea sp. CAU 1676]